MRAPFAIINTLNSQINFPYYLFTSCIDFLSCFIVCFKKASILSCKGVTRYSNDFTYTRLAKCIYSLAA